MPALTPAPTSGEVVYGVRDLVWFSQVPGYWHLSAEVLFLLKGVILFGLLSNKVNCFKALSGPILFFWVLFNICCDPMWKVLIFQLQFLLYFQARLSLGLDMEQLRFFSSLTLIFWWLGNIILNQCSEREQGVPSRVAGSEATLKPEIPQSPSSSPAWQKLLTLLCKTLRGPFEVKKQAGDTDAGPSQVFLLCWSSSYSNKALLKITDHFQDFERREKNSTVVKLSPNLQKKKKKSSGFIKDQQYNHFSELERAAVITVLWFFKGSTRCHCLKKSSILQELGLFLNVHWMKRVFLHEEKSKK